MQQVHPDGPEKPLNRLAVVEDTARRFPFALHRNGEIGNKNGCMQIFSCFCNWIIKNNYIC
jgi:hypothetical protein